MFLNLVESELKKRENFSKTENGAVGYKSTNSALVDINYKVSSLRNSSEEEIETLFSKAFHENKEYALKWLFFSRDVREGLGERRLFRVCYRKLADLDEDLFLKNLHNISEYGRWDDLVSLLGINDNIDKTIIDIIDTQLKIDISAIEKNKSISLLGKWLPSENASSKTTKAMAKKVRTLLDLSPRKYRLMLSKLRAYSNVVEVDMCNNKWNTIDYEKVPSLANLRYKDAFLNHDENRRREYLLSVKKGESKFNMGTASPVDIVSRYTYGKLETDDSLELAWSNLKDVMVSDTLVVADGSGSMTIPITRSTSALDVAIALSIYTSEHNSGVYKDKYITFSNTPRFVDMSEDVTLKDKIIRSKKHCEVSNTNIEAVFKLILDVAVENNISKDEMVDNVLIISDMEFDAAQSSGWFNTKSNPLTKPLFEKIKDSYKDAGYDLPKLVFWNVASRTGTIPLTENDLGVTLISGFSQNVLKMVMSDRYNPYEVLIEMLDNDRYSRIVVE